MGKWFKAMKTTGMDARDARSVPAEFLACPNRWNALFVYCSSDFMYPQRCIMKENDTINSCECVTLISLVQEPKLLFIKTILRRNLGSLFRRFSKLFILIVVQVPVKGGRSAEAPNVTAFLRALCYLCVFIYKIS